MRVFPVALALTLALAGSSFAQASGNPRGMDQRQAQSQSQGASPSYERSRSFFFLPPADPAEIRRCALSHAILNAFARSACGGAQGAGASAARIAGAQPG
jgi:hypothetical protein